MHISKRDGISSGKAWGIRAIAILLALIVDAVIIFAIVKLNPLKVYGSMADGAFGTGKRIWVTIRDCMILTCIAIGLAPAFKMRFWNIGAEGQMLVGGIATGVIALLLIGGGGLWWSTQHRMPSTASAPLAADNAASVPTSPMTAATKAASEPLTVAAPAASSAAAAAVTAQAAPAVAPSPQSDPQQAQPPDKLEGKGKPGV